jgi:hypothetical protein
MPVELICRSSMQKFDLPWRHISTQKDGEMRPVTGSAKHPSRRAKEEWIASSLRSLQ